MTVDRFKLPFFRPRLAGWFSGLKRVFIPSCQMSALGMVPRSYLAVISQNWTLSCHVALALFCRIIIESNNRYLAISLPRCYGCSSILPLTFNFSTSTLSNPSLSTTFTAT